jgi:hypothetical protein
LLKQQLKNFMPLPKYYTRRQPLSPVENSNKCYQHAASHFSNSTQPTQTAPPTQNQRQPITIVLVAYTDFCDSMKF